MNNETLAKHASSSQSWPDGREWLNPIDSDQTKAIAYLERPLRPIPWLIHTHEYATMLISVNEANDDIELGSFYTDNEGNVAHWCTCERICKLIDDLPCDFLAEHKEKPSSRNKYAVCENLYILCLEEGKGGELWKANGEYPNRMLPDEGACKALVGM